MNFFSEQGNHLFDVVVRGEYTIRGMRNADLRKLPPGKSPGQVSRTLKRLSLIKKVGGTDKNLVLIPDSGVSPRHGSVKNSGQIVHECFFGRA